jgi:hypothetical protein
MSGYMKSEPLQPRCSDPKAKPNNVRLYPILSPTRELYSYKDHSNRNAPSFPRPPRNTPDGDSYPDAQRTSQGPEPVTFPAMTLAVC